MPVEIKGNQLRIPVRNKKLFKKGKQFWGTQDVGRKGGLQRLAGRLKKTGEWETQSWRLNLSDYSRIDIIISQINRLKVGVAKKRRARLLARKWWRKRRR